MQHCSHSLYTAGSERAGGLCTEQNPAGAAAELQRRRRGGAVSPEGSLPSDCTASSVIVHIDRRSQVLPRLPDGVRILIP